MTQGVNLLPDDFQKKEEKIRSKKEEKKNILLHIPLNAKSTKKKQLVTNFQSSLWQRLRNFFDQSKIFKKNILKKDSLSLIEIKKDISLPNLSSEVIVPPSLPAKNQIQKESFIKKEENVFPSLMVERHIENVSERLHIPSLGFLKTMQVNLVEGTKKLDFRIRRWIFAGVAFLLFFLFLGIGRGYVFFKEKSTLMHLGNVQREQNQLEESLKTLEDFFESTLLAMVKANEARALLEERPSWVRALNFFEENTAEGIRYKTFAVSPDGNVTLEVEARDYETLVRQFYIFDMKKEIIEYYQFENIESIRQNNDNKEGVRVKLTLRFQKEYLKNIFSS